jgi:hypothetical protein
MLYKKAVTMSSGNLARNLGEEVTTTQPTLAEARAALFSIIATRTRKDRYAALLSRTRSSQARDLIQQLFDEVVLWQAASGKRARKLRDADAKSYHDALERLVGDLLRARAAKHATGRIFHALGRMTFDDVPVSYKVFNGVFIGLQGLSYLGVELGTRKSARTTAFWATDKLLQRAEDLGIHLGNIGEHFKPEPPPHPLVLRGPTTWKGKRKIKGQIIRVYERTKVTKGLEAEVRELNDFLAGCDIRGGDHFGYTRNFNNASWKKGGRLYSVEGGYQQLPEKKRWLMTINGEAVAEVDVRASHLTIYHSILKQPLSRDSDPYEHLGADRKVAKQWVVVSFGNSAPATKWPDDMVEDYNDDNPGKDLRAVNPKVLGKKMLEAFPLLRLLKTKFKKIDIWGDLQRIEANAIVSTMLTLKREHNIPALSTHDGLVVPRSGIGWTKTILSREYEKFAGVEPVLTVDPEEADIVSAVDL